MIILLPERRPVTTKSTSDAPEVAPDVLPVYRDAFLRSLSAENKSVRTRQSYGEAVDLMTAFLRKNGMPTTPQAITREHLTEWVNEMLATWKAATAANRYRGASRFFAYLVEAGELRESPMARMKPPKVEEMEVPVIRDGDLLKLPKACEGKSFRERRDYALVLVLLDSGLRVHEMAGLKMQLELATDSWVELQEGVLWGRREEKASAARASRKQVPEGARSLPLRACKAATCGQSIFLDRRAWTHRPKRPLPDRRTPLRTRPYSPHSSAPVPAHLRAQAAGGKHERFRPDARSAAVANRLREARFSREE